jgi:hypothetical protein
MAYDNTNVVVAYEATVSLFPTGADGLPMRGLALWQGGVVEQVRMGKQFPNRQIRPTGATSDRRVQINGGHSIELRRSWLVRSQAGPDFMPDHGEYCLELVWQDQMSRRWVRRLYKGVTWDNVEWASVGLFQFSISQSFTAREMVSTAGSGSIDTPPEFPVSDEFPFGFFQPSPLLYSDAAMRYLLGRVSMPFGWRITRVVVEAIAGRSSTDLELVVNGVSQPTTITIPGNASAVSVTASITPSGLTIGAGAEVRWRARSGPSVSGDCATQVGLVVYAVPLGT